MQPRSKHLDAAHGKHERQDQEQERKQQDGIDRDLATLPVPNRAHQCVTSLRVTNSDSSGTVQVPRNGMSA
jgi:hypothetical protein